MIDDIKLYQESRKPFDEGMRNYILKIYNYMTIALLVTALAALAVTSYEPVTRLFFTINSDGQLIEITALGIIAMFAPLLFAMYFFWQLATITVGKAKILLWIYAALVGISLAPIIIFYTGQSIASTFFVCATLFGFMSIYGYTTKKDLTSVGSLLLMGLIGLIITSVVNIFLRNATINYAITLIGIFIFMGLIAWDTQKIKNIYYASEGELKQKMAIVSALILYLDIINLFLYLLRFLGTGKKK